MKKWMKKRWNDCRGMIAIEALTGLILFMFFMLAIYSLIPLFMAQNTIGHALSECSQSMALESYRYKNFNDGMGSFADFPLEMIQETSMLFGQFSGATSLDNAGDASFFSNEHWFDEDDLTGAAAQAVAKERFASYLAGGASAADAMLRELGVVDGLDGLNFEETKVDGSDLTVSVTYKINLMFRMGSFGEFESTQQVTSRLWGA